ncbi:hypothetical protein BH09PSE6_BH09PSE6_04390 [soil metagenome]
MSRQAAINARRAALHLALVGLALLASGCASLSQKDCMKGDWTAVGKDDALYGFTPDRLKQHYEACAEYGVKPNPTQYAAGYQIGLVGFCVPANGFSVGRRGSSYYNQCPAQMQGAFVMAMELGQDVASLDSRISDIDSKVSDLQDKIKDKDTSDDKRKDYRRRISDLKDERRSRDWDRDRLLERARQRGYGAVY